MIATYLHDKIAKHLGPGTNQTNTGDFLGLSRSHWSRYLRGHRSPSEKQINKWLRICREAGIHTARDVREAVATCQPAQPHPTRR